MPSHLEKILASVRERTEAMKAILGPNDTARLVADRRDTPRGFTAALSSSSARTKIIAEVKRASPSKGLLREDLDAVEYARDCEDAGAVALSVLTERNFFQGSVEDLQAVREAVKLPVLRKDFIIDPYQVPRSYGTGADAILVIVRAVPDDTVLRQIFDAAENLRLDVLTEVWDEKDAERALRIGADSPGALRLDVPRVDRPRLPLRHRLARRRRRRPRLLPPPHPLPRRRGPRHRRRSLRRPQGPPRGPAGGRLEVKV